MYNGLLANLLSVKLLSISGYLEAVIWKLLSGGWASSVRMMPLHDCQSELSLSTEAQCPLSKASRKCLRQTET